MTVIGCYNVKFYLKETSFICIEINTSLRLLSTEIKIEKKVASSLDNGIFKTNFSTKQTKKYKTILIYENYNVD